ncbi:hypothetical protein [Maribacter sp. 2307ULW6-5]|uniref:hypothetical protein n=1 Tax=Maribacter sp. 2307ULW6-5 TaxID=3386275 RepID=UPI0039BD209C
MDGKIQVLVGKSPNGKNFMEWFFSFFFVPVPEKAVNFCVNVEHFLLLALQYLGHRPASA